jgi:Flp pilus assembly pilin Flp
MTPPAAIRRGRDESGQATVELALALPLLAVLLLALVQVGLVVRAHVLVGHAVREAARAAAVDADPGAAADAAATAGGLDPDRVEVSTGGRAGPGSRVTVVVRYQVPTDVALIGRFVADLELTAEATMRVE